MAQPVPQPRRGPAPFASFDHDVSDEVREPSSPEMKQTFQLPEIREDGGGCSPIGIKEGGVALEVATNVVAGAGTLSTPVAPRIDISRASSSSHQDSRDSSPEMALFGGNGESRAHLDLGFREDGALDLRSSTEELAFLEGPPTESRPPPPTSVSAAASRRHSRKDSQSSEVALLAVSGRTSRVSSVGSQCSAHSALSGLGLIGRVSRLSVASGMSRSPSPHKMLLETSFCGPKPIETDPDICTTVVEERLLGIAGLVPPNDTVSAVNTKPASNVPDSMLSATELNTCDKREICTEVTVEAMPATVESDDAVVPKSTVELSLREKKRERPKSDEARARSKEDRDAPLQSSVGRTKNIVRIKLKPDDEYEDDDESETDWTTVRLESARKPASLDLSGSNRAAATSNSVSAAASPTPSRRRTPSPAGMLVSRKSSFCSLFKSRETIASPDSPSTALRRKKSLTEGRSRSRSRDRSTTPTSAAKIKGSVLSLFRTPRRSVASPSPSSRDGSPVVQPQRHVAVVPNDAQRRADKLKYYEDSTVIHIPLHTPPDEQHCTFQERSNDHRLVEITTHQSPSERENQPTSSTSLPLPDFSVQKVTESTVPVSTARKRTQRTVLPDGSIIIPLHSPTEKSAESNVSVDMTPHFSESPAKSNESHLTKTESSSEGSRAGCEGSTEATPLESTPNICTAVNGRIRRKEHILFSTQVGSTEQMFSTQLSITKTPSVTSEISGSFPSFPDCEDTRPLRDSYVGTGSSGPVDGDPETVATHDSSGSEASSELVPTHCSNDVEHRGLVIQESFEEELPYVPTTLPQERSVALPMVPVRERGARLLAAAPRPRPPPRAAPRLPCAPPPAGPPPPPADRIRIQLPRRPRATQSASSSRSRSSSTGDGGHLRTKHDWIDFEEVPERRKQPKRIQTLPAVSAGEGEGVSASGSGRVSGTDSVVFSYVEPEQCRCECHARLDDELPLLADDSGGTPHAHSSCPEATGRTRDSHHADQKRSSGDTSHRAAH